MKMDMRLKKDPDSSTHIVEAIWPTSSVVARNESGNSSVLPLRAFIQETLRRSRTSYSTLQVALYYLILIRPHVPSHDFTMEQPDDRHASKAIQCGRRMFLAALILASKYLQDRNYSARAWSKISGLNTREINDNELAFLLAVNWKLHVTDEVYNRWTECVMKHTPPQPPSSGGTAQLQYDAQCNEFRHVILNLTPELDNLEELAPWSPILSAREIPVRSLYTPPAERIVVFRSKSDIQTVTTQQVTPPVMEPTLPTVCAPNRFAPALGLLPTPRLTPQTSGFSTPAVSAASCLLAKGSSMGFAMAQATSTVATQSADRWPLSETPSPPYQFTRRSSLANSVSTASSPESMVSDSSRVSRTSSVSSAASLASAPSSKLDVQARCRYAKQFGERWSLRPTVPSVAEDYEENCLTASPESYTAPVGKDFCDMPLGMPVAHRQSEMDDAARALQELQRDGANQRATAPLRPSLKRRRALSIENSLQDNVRDMLASRYTNTESEWLDTVVRSRPDLGVHGQQVPTRTSIRAGHKRVCCPAEAAGPYTIPSLHPAVGGYGGSGMWAGILN